MRLEIADLVDAHYTFLPRMNMIKSFISQPKNSFSNTNPLENWIYNVAYSKLILIVFVQI